MNQNQELQRQNQGLEKYNNSDQAFLKAFNSIAICRAANTEIGDQIIIAMQYMGVVNFPTQVEIKFLIEYIRNNYGIFNLKEISLAFEMAAAGKLDCDKHFQNFSPVYFSSVMNAYKKVAVEARKVEMDKFPKIEYKAPRIEDNEVIEYVMDYWETSKIKRIEFINPRAYDILWREGKLRPTPEEKERIKSEVIARMKNEAAKSGNIKDIKNEIEDDAFLQTMCKKLAVAKYLNKLFNS